MASLPFDLAFPVSSLLTTGLNFIITLVAIFLIDFVVSHGIEFKRIVILSAVGCFLAPTAAYFLIPLLPMDIPYVISIYLLPLLIWIVAGEIILKDYDLKNRAMVAAVGFVFYSLVSFFSLSSILISMISM